MPQPALHLMLAQATLQYWEHTPAAPFDAGVEANRNAFLIGSLCPDLGLFPGGDVHLSRRLHRERSGAFVRALFAATGSDVERAFAVGWLSHFLADVAIHPLVNAAAAEHARDRIVTLTGHVRVEVGLDAWLAWQHPVLRATRLRPLLSRHNSAFLRAALAATYGAAPSPAQLVQMQRGMLRFTHLAVHFATRVARHVCWKEGGPGLRAPLSSSLTWRIVTLMSTRQSTTHAYLNPLRPGAALLESVERALLACHTDLEHWLHTGLDHLPDYNLETGALAPAARSVA